MQPLYQPLFFLVLFIPVASGSFLPPQAYIFFFRGPRGIRIAVARPTLFGAVIDPACPLTRVITSVGAPNDLLSVVS